MLAHKWGKQINQSLVSNDFNQNKQKQIVIIDKSTDAIALSSILRKEKRLTIIGLANNFKRGFGSLMQLRPDYLIINPEILTTKELNQLLKFSVNNQIEVIIFGTPESFKTLGSSQSKFKQIEKPSDISTLNSNHSTYQKFISHLNIQKTGTLSLESKKSISNLFPRETVKIMIVNNNPKDKIALNQIFKSYPKLRVIAVANHGEEALFQLKRVTPDIILLALDLPVMDGLTFIEKLSPYIKSKIVLLSSGSNSQRETALKQGIKHEVKPPTNSTHENPLIQTLQKVINF